MHFDELSYEIVLLIFENLSHEQLSLTVAPVCKQWRLFAYDPCLWKRVKLRGRNKLTSMLKPLFDRSPLLTEFIFSETYNLMNVVPYFANCPNLRKLHLSSCGSINANCMEQLVRHCPLVDDFAISYCCYFGLAIMNAVTGWKRLKNISFSYLNGHDSFWDNELVKIIANKCLNLETAVLDFHRMEDTPLLAFLNQSGSRLTKLHVNLASATGNGIRLLNQCPLIVDLRLNYAAKVSETDLLVIQKLTRLRSLTLTCFDLVTSPGFCMLFRGKSFNGVEELTLYDCYYLDDTALDVITSCCPSLKYLNIALTTNVTDVGLRSISYHCKNLEILHLDGIFNITRNAFLDIPILFPALKHLTVHCCKNVWKLCCAITRSVLRAIEEHNPNLKLRGSSCFP